MNAAHMIGGPIDLQKWAVQSLPIESRRGITTMSSHDKIWADVYARTYSKLDREDDCLRITRSAETAVTRAVTDLRSRARYYLAQKYHEGSQMLLVFDEITKRLT